MRILPVLVTCTIILLPLFSLAQKVKLTKSSSTSWSGGIAGRYGTGYNFTVAFSDFGPTEPAPDTMWIGNKCIPLVIKVGDKPQPFNAVRTAGKKSVSYFLVGSTSWEDDPRSIDATGAKGNKQPGGAPPLKYKGVALLSYKYKGKQKYFVIEKVLDRKPPVNYP